MNYYEYSRVLDNLFGGGFINLKVAQNYTAEKIIFWPLRHQKKKERKSQVSLMKIINKRN